MKIKQTIVTLALLAITLSSFAQDTRYHDAMLRNVNMLDTAMTEKNTHHGRE